MYVNGQKKAQIRRPDLFPHASILENWSFCLVYENGHKKAQIRRPNLFPRASMLENWSFYLVYENGQKKAQIRRRPDLFSRRCIWKRISFAVFTNFAATLTRQPSAASLAPRLK